MKNGFSLVELIVVLALITIISSFAIFNFQEFSRKVSIEAQVKMLHGELQMLRAQSVFEKQPRAVKVTSTMLSKYSSDVATGTPVARLNLLHPVTINITSPIVAFNQQGITTDCCSICISESGNPAAIDSLVISETRIQMGKRTPGKPCNTDYIKTR